MAQFRTMAVTASGEVVNAVMDGATEAEIVARLQRQGQIPLKIEAGGSRSGFVDLLSMEFGRARGVSRQDVAEFTRELSIMLGAGQDLDRALRFMVETARSRRLRAVSERLRDTVRDGASLATALAQHPASFSRLYVGLIRAGEAGGTLAATLDRLALLLERERSLAATITSAMIYPALLLVAAIGSITLLLTEVLPQFVPLFEQNGAALPRSTQILIDLGDAVAAYGIYALLAIVAAGLVIRQALRRPGPRMAIERGLLRVPVVGGLIREVLAARFTRTLGTLVINGVPLIAALGIVRDALGNLVAGQAVDAAAASAKGGAGLSRPLGEAGIFPPRTIHLLRLGEETASLGPMSLRAAEIHEESTRIGVQRLISLLVPTITIVMGAAVGGIVSSLLLAMLSLNDLAN